jgi:hypothetical protein
MRRSEMRIHKAFLERAEVNLW